MLTAVAIGFAAGVIGSIPVAGAVSVLVMERGLAGRVRRGLLLAGGAALAEGLWCLAARLGVGTILARWPLTAGVADVVGVVVLLAVGTWFLVVGRRRTADVLATAEPAPAAPRRDFGLGFVLVAANPAVLFNWMAALAVIVGFGLRPLAGPPGSFSLGVVLGVWAWFAVLLLILDRLRGRIPAAARAHVLTVMGGLLMVLGIWGLVRLVS